MITGGDGARALTKIDEVMSAASHCRIIPSGLVGVKRVCAASLGSAVFHNRTLLHYERKNLELPELGRLALPDSNAAV